MAKPKADPAADGQSPDILPATVRPVRDYGFIDDDGAPLYFRRGQSVTNPAHVAALVARGVELHQKG